MTSLLWFVGVVPMINLIPNPNYHLLHMYGVSVGVWVCLN